MLNQLLTKFRSAGEKKVNTLPGIHKVGGIPLYTSPYIVERERVGREVLERCAAASSEAEYSIDQLWEAHPAFPLAICFNVHSLCNERCVMCPYRSTDAGQPTRIMDMAGYQKTLDEFIEIGGRILTFNNFSDIFAHPVGMDYVRPALKRQKEIQTYFVTNALALKHNYVDEILTTGWDGIFYVSCHGFSDEVFQKVTGINGFSIVKEHTQYLAAHHPAPERIIIQYATDYSSRDEMEAARDFWGGLGCTLNFFPTHTFAGNSQHREQLIMPGRLAGCKGWGYDAGQLFFQAVIQQNGNLTLCCHDLQGKVVIGNAFKDGLAQTWKSERMKRIIQMIYRGSNDPRVMSLCRKCTMAQMVT